ncbi:MAG: DNA-binding response regulator [Balneola sp.]|nr:MAG: DNA-binding response regulator [Balneola sp.]
MIDIRVLILEDEMVIARDLQKILKRIGITEILIVNEPDEMVDQSRSFLPHLMLCDINLEEDKVDGITLCQKIIRSVSTNIIFITANANDNYLVRAQEVKPLNYLLKPFDEEQVATTIALALSKPEVQQSGHLKKDYEQLLTESEYNILTLISENKTTTEIASQLFISPKTVENHRRNISQKLNLEAKKNTLLSWAIQHKDEI